MTASDYEDLLWAFQHAILCGY